jgi:hypothetical protein
MAAIGDSIGSHRRAFGTFRYESVDHPPAFVVRASGWSSPKLFKGSLVEAETFGAAHPEGWWYVADLRHEVGSSPRNIRYVRRVRKLPHNRGYIVVARLPLRIALRPLRLLGGPDTFVRSVEAALEYAGSRTT